MSIKLAFAGIPRKNRRSVQHEANECKAFASFLRLLAPRHGIYWTHVPNGGFRHIKTATDLKAAGQRAGVWDYYFRKQGLSTGWIEFKHGYNKITPEQHSWRFDLEPLGDTFDVAYTALAGLQILTMRGFLPAGAFHAYAGGIHIPVRP